MKKLILALLAVSTIGAANAQKNSILIYGQAGVNTGKQDSGNGTESKSVNWMVNPGAGFQFTDNITVGLQGGIWSVFEENRSSNAAQTQWNRNAFEQREWQAGVFFRYEKRLSKLFTVFTQLDLSYISGTDISENETRTLDFVNNSVVETVIYNYDYYNGFQAFVQPVIKVDVYKGVALNFSFGGLAYRTISYDTPKAPAPLNSTVDQSGLVFTWGQQAHFGISQNIRCKTRTGNVKPMDDLRPMRMGNDDEDEDDE